MIEEMVNEGLSPDMESAEKRVTDRVNITCKNILGNTAVFKADQKGYNGFKRFLSTCEIK